MRKLLIQTFFSITVLMISCLAWAEDTVSGYLIEHKNDALVIRQKGGGKQTVIFNSSTALRFSRKDFVTADIQNIPINSKLYVSIEHGVATLVTVEEVPK